MTATSAVLSNSVFDLSYHPVNLDVQKNSLVTTHLGKSCLLSFLLSFIACIYLQFLFFFHLIVWVENKIRSGFLWLFLYFYDLSRIGTGGRSGDVKMIFARSVNHLKTF